MRTEPSGSGMLTLKTSLARVLFFLDPATPMRASTSALRSFKIPTQSTLESDQDGGFNPRRPQTQRPTARRRSLTLESCRCWVPGGSR